MFEAAVVWAIRQYQRRLSPRLGRGKCRFYPTCSEYAVLSVQKHGVLRGMALALQRLWRCRPSNTESCIDFP